METAISSGVVVLVIFLLFWYLRQSAAGPARPSTDSPEAIVEYGLGLKLAGWIITAIALVVLYLVSVVVQLEGRTKLVAVSLLTFFLLGGGYSIIDTRTQIRLSSYGIEHRYPWGRNRFISWKDVTEVTFPLGQRFIIKGSHGEQICVDAHLKGLSTLIAFFKTSLAPAVYGEAAKKYAKTLDPERTIEHLRVSFDDVEFDTTGWQLYGEDHEARMWCNEAGDALSLYVIPYPPDLPASVNEMGTLRQHYRAMAAVGGGAIISADRVFLDYVASVRLIVKYSQYPTGTVYYGSFTVPFEKFSVVLKTACREHDVPGRREVIVADQLMAQGQLRHDKESGNVIGWMRDPYDPHFQAPLLRNVAEDERYDAQFPAHPLSRLRRYLVHLQPTIRLSSELKRRPRFAGPRKKRR